MPSVHKTIGDDFKGPAGLFLSARYNYIGRYLIKHKVRKELKLKRQIDRQIDAGRARAPAHAPLVERFFLIKFVSINAI